ncbi:MAG TPA: CpsD/CapB family tyrosine-protein kinase [Bacilli bacterium]|nr:CpsD/CapB family tyrosine-protein kinase [Bacilli bacterium]
MKTRSRSYSLICLENPKSPVAEAYRTLRTNLQYTSGKHQDVQVLVVTSADKREGKTTVVSNLAVVMVKAEQKVLLIDADLRKPSLHYVFPVQNEIGLTQVLGGDCPFEEAVQEMIDIPGLHVLTAGEGPTAPAELLGSKAMRRLLNKVRDEYDIVLIDTPPLLPVTDAQVLAPCVDGAVLVVRSGKVARPLVQKVKGMLEHVGIPVLGAVLNQVSDKDSKYYYY